jgi:hypothetical protein
MTALVGFAGVVIGAFLTAALQYFFWKRHHRQEMKSQQEREVRRERASAAERLRQVSVSLIEISRQRPSYVPPDSIPAMVATILNEQDRPA